VASCPIWLLDDPLREGAARLPPIRFVSRERRWLAAFMVPLAAWSGWRAFVYLGLVAGCLVAAGLLGFALPATR
jgi:hypothetical protein